MAMEAAEERFAAERDQASLFELRKRESLPLKTFTPGYRMPSEEGSPPPPLQMTAQRRRSFVAHEEAGMTS